MDSEKVIKRDNEYVLHTYNRNPVVLEKGHGLYAEGPEGQKYLDFTSGIGVNSLGYCDLAWAEAVSDQAHKLQHTSNLYYTAPCGKLAKKLCKRTGMSKVFFGNSGAEANEGAIKAARKYSVDYYGKDRTTVITLVNSFHGRTIATLTATGQEVFHNYFGPFNEGFLYAPAGDIEALQELVDRNTCAVMLELIQGEGGVMALDPDYVQAVRKLCDEKDLVLIVDEVQTGVGRTGTFLCCEHYNLKPDIVTLAKGLGGGLPIGAVLLSEKVAGGMGPGTHGSTFGGNPVVCAGANVVVDRMDTSFLANVNDRAVQLRAFVRDGGIFGPPVDRADMLPVNAGGDEHLVAGQGHFRGLLNPAERSGLGAVPVQERVRIHKVSHSSPSLSMIWTGLIWPSSSLPVICSISSRGSPSDSAVP